MSESVVDVGELSFRYPGAQRDAVQDVSFTVRRGEIFGFLGPNGAGKSTIQKLLTGLLSGYRGRACVLDRDLATWNDALYERIGVGFELPASYRKLSGRENLELFAGFYSGDVDPPQELLDLVGLGDAADQRAGEYSKGMLLRLNLARALLNRPELLFLDEPTGGQDPANAVRVKRLIRERRAAGTSVFLTTHDMSVADELCDRVAFLVDGRIRVVDSPRALKLAHGARRVRVEVRRGGAMETRTLALTELDDDALRDILASGEIETIHTEEASLEQVFLEVTGESLR